MLPPAHCPPWPRRSWFYRFPKSPCLNPATRISYLVLARDLKIPRVFRPELDSEWGFEWECNSRRTSVPESQFRDQHRDGKGWYITQFGDPAAALEDIRSVLLQAEMEFAEV
jgi:hypothetical protein